MSAIGHPSTSQKPPEPRNTSARARPVPEERASSTQKYVGLWARSAAERFVEVEYAHEICEVIFVLLDQNAGLYQREDQLANVSSIVHSPMLQDVARDGS